MSRPPRGADYQDKTQLPETLRARMASCVDLINP